MHSVVSMLHLPAACLLQCPVILSLSSYPIFCGVCPQWQVSNVNILTLGVNCTGSKKQRKQVMWFDAIMDQQRFGSGGHVTQYGRRT